MTEIIWQNEPEGHDLEVCHNGKYLDIVFNEPSGTWSTMYDGERLLGGFGSREAARNWLTHHVMNLENVASLEAEAKHYAAQQRFWRIVAITLLSVGLLAAAIYRMIP